MTPEIGWEWEERGARYRDTVASGPSSSSWLRDTVLKPELIRLLGNCSDKRVLDAGTGGGWLFDAVDIGQRHACDIAKLEVVRRNVAFVQADIASLPYPSHHFAQSWPASYCAIAKIWMRLRPSCTA